MKRSPRLLQDACAPAALVYGNVNDFIVVAPGQIHEKAHGIYDIAVIRMAADGQLMHHAPARPGQVMDHPEGVFLIEDMFRRSKIQHKVEGAFPGVGRLLRVQIKDGRLVAFRNINGLIREAAAFEKLSDPGAVPPAGDAIIVGTFRHCLRPLLPFPDVPGRGKPFPESENLFARRGIEIGRAYVHDGHAALQEAKTGHERYVCKRDSHFCFLFWFQRQRGSGARAHKNRNPPAPLSSANSFPPRKAQDGQYRERCRSPADPGIFPRPLRRRRRRSA